MKIIMPKLGFSMTEGTLTEWFVGDGAEVVAGDPLYAIESDKSVQEVEAPVTGRLNILASIDGTYLVGQVLGEIIET